MDQFFIPNESDFRKWIRDALKEYFENTPAKPLHETGDSGEEPLLTRKEIAGLFRVSLVTLHAWMNQGLPSHKQGGRVYFLRSEVMAYLRQKGKPITDSS